MSRLTPILLLASLLSGCQGGSAVPALRVSTSAAEEAPQIEAGVSSLLGRRVIIADDAFIQDSTIIISPLQPAALRPGMRNDRDTGSPQHVRLLLSRGRCYLEHVESSKRLLIDGLICRTAD